MKLKPLSKDERNQLLDIMVNEDPEPILRDVFSAMEYWREAVRRAIPREVISCDTSGSWQEFACLFCGAAINFPKHELNHAADCPWVLTQEDK